MVYSGSSIAPRNRTQTNGEKISSFGTHTYSTEFLFRLCRSLLTNFESGTTTYSTLFETLQNYFDINYTMPSVPSSIDVDNSVASFVETFDNEDIAFGYGELCVQPKKITFTYLRTIYIHSKFSPFPLLFTGVHEVFVPEVFDPEVIQKIHPKALYVVFVEGIGIEKANFWRDSIANHQHALISKSSNSLKYWIRKDNEAMVFLESCKNDHEDSKTQTENCKEWIVEADGKIAEKKEA